MVLGCYYLTRHRPFAKGEGKIFSGVDEARMAYDAGEVSLQASVKCRINGEIKDTTVGRLLLWEIVPKGLSFEDSNIVLGKKQLAGLIDKAFRRCSAKDTVLLADRLKNIGTSMRPLRGSRSPSATWSFPRTSKRSLIMRPLKSAIFSSNTLTA